MDIAKFRDIIVESFESNSKTLLEAPFWDRSARANGERRRNDFIKKLEDSWEEWLGMTGSKGTQRDMINFLISRVGFSRQDTARILDISSTPIVNSNTHNEPTTEKNPEPESSQDQPDQENKTDTNPQDTTQNKGGYSEIKTYEDAYKNLDYGLGRKSKTIADNDMIYRSFEYISKNIDTIPEVELKAVEDVMQDTVSYLENIENSKYRISPNEGNIVLGKLQKRLNPNPPQEDQSTHVNDSIDYSLYEDEGLLDQPLTKQEVNDILNDAASYAFTNNIIGNKNYARANGSGIDDNSSNDSYRNNSSNSGLSKPVEKATHLNDFAQKVFNSSAFSGMNDETISNLRALSKKSFDQITDQADINAMANVGWAFLRNLK